MINMIKFNKIVYLFFLILFLNSNSNSHEKVANSPCNILIDKIIDNYEQIKDHYYSSFTVDMYGFVLESTWDSTQVEILEDNRKVIGKKKLRRDENGNIFFQNIYPSYASKVNFKPGDKVMVFAPFNSYSSHINVHKNMLKYL